MHPVVLKQILWLVFAVFLISVVAGEEHTVKKTVCKLETHRSVKYTCKRTDSDNFEDCGDSESVGTVVQSQCREGYYSPSALPLMQCHEGVWDFVATCIPECGIVPANAKTVPWYSYIYEELPMEYRGRCGGTIITNNVVVSAAHCFGTTRTHNALDYAVVVQPFSPTFAKKDLEAKGNLYTSIHRVRKIDIPVLYKGELTNYQYDIALLTLQTPVVFSAGVMPACLDFQQDFDRMQLTAGNVGTVPVWSSPVTGNSVLSLHEYPYIPTEMCLDKAPPTFQGYITGDKFCAGLVNRTMIHRGNSGSGLTFPSKERLLTRHYLRGIVSISPEGSIEQYWTPSDFVTFTKITSFEHFIKSNL
nr:modular serine protease [Helicoverpa armigera]